jgi:hypothetical protein
MAQGDMNIANQGFPAFRADLNDQLEALVTNSSGATAPATTFPHQWWLDTSTTPSTLRQRNAADDAWIVVGLLNQSTNTFNLPVAQGGTGAATLAANNVLLGNGTSAVQAVAPGSSGNLLTSNGTTWESQPPPPAGGKVLQVVSATKTDSASFSLATGTLSDVSGLSVTITPSSATSKFLIIFTVHLGNNTTSINPYVVLDRNGTSISLGDSNGSRTRTTAAAGIDDASAYSLTSVSQNFLDSPATTSTLTYKLRVGGFSNRTFTLNHTAINNTEGNTASSTITVMEIAA